MASILLGFLIILYCTAEISSAPLIPTEEQTTPKISTATEKIPTKLVKSQQNNGAPGAAGGNQGAANIATSQVDFIGKNVLNIVSSSLTGNVGGIFSGGLNLLNTNNRVNNLFGSTFGGTVPSPIANGNRLIITHSTTVATTAPAATAASAAAASAGEDEDGEEDYDVIV